MVNLSAPVRRFAQPNAKIAQLILRFAQKLHHRFLATLLFHEGHRCRTRPFGEPALSTSLLLRAIIWSRALFGTTRGATMQKQMKIATQRLPIDEWVKGLAAIRESEFTLEAVQDYIE